MGCCFAGSKKDEKSLGKSPAPVSTSADNKTKVSSPDGRQKPSEATSTDPKPPTKPVSKPPVVLPPDPLPEPSILQEVNIKVTSVAGDTIAEVKVDADIAMKTLYSRIRNEISNPERHRFDLRIKGGKVLEEGPKKLSDFGVTEDTEVVLYAQKT